MLHLLTLLPIAENAETKIGPHLLDFCFNGWGEKFRSDKDNSINRQLYFMETFNGTLENHKRLCSGRRFNRERW